MLLNQKFLPTLPVVEIVLAHQFEKTLNKLK